MKLRNMGLNVMTSAAFSRSIFQALHISFTLGALAVLTTTLLITAPPAKAGQDTQQGAPKSTPKNTMGDVVVVAATIRPEGNGRYSFDVTLRHGDTGWKHYANLWEVVAPDGTVLGTRVLVHPHVDEQPFTRSLSDIAIPASVTEVLIRARGNVHGFSANTFRVKMPRP